jgi:aspartyl-tRNA(Asn)/glutamyl-tRNA(Gln) amidotransferase subunit B
VDGDIVEAIEKNGLWFQEIPPKEYAALAEEAVRGEDKVLQEFVDYKKYPQGKLMFLVGKMMRLGPTERIDPATAEKSMKAHIEKLTT